MTSMPYMALLTVVAAALFPPTYGVADVFLPARTPLARGAAPNTPTVTLRNTADPNVDMPAAGLGTGCAIGEWETNVNVWRLAVRVMVRVSSLEWNE